MSTLQEVTDYAAIVYFVLMIILVLVIALVLLIIKRKVKKARHNIENKLTFLNDLRHIKHFIDKTINSSRHK